ncbi:MAG: hypothetical protein MJY87_08510 [Fibrobacter sp.]|nr:hypothetical protein [Fibrobacter sp.]
MSKYIVKNIQCGLSACGLCADTVNVEVEFQDETGKSVFISAVEFESFPNIYRTEESVYQKLLNSGAESEAAADKLSRKELDELGDEFFGNMNANCVVYNGEGYAGFYDDKKCGGDLHDAIRFVVYIVRSDWDEIDRAKKEFVGKAIGDFEIPKCDAERAWEQGVELGEEE